MSALQPSMRGSYFEDLKVGQQLVSSARTVTESDIVTFAGLSGDYNQIHTDAEFSKETPFGQRVAHGLLGLSIASGLIVQTGLMEGTIIARNPPMCEACGPLLRCFPPRLVSQGA